MAAPAAPPQTDITIADLRGGMNDADPPSMLPEDMAVLMENVELWESSLGERRLGCEPLDLGESDLDTCDQIVHLSQRFPTNDIANAELWAIGRIIGGGFIVARRTNGIWHQVTVQDDLNQEYPWIFDITTQALHRKFYIAYRSLDSTGQAALDRLHVWDTHSTPNLRRAGIAEPDAPTAVDEGSGSFSGVRYYRVRFTEEYQGVTVRRSEPSESFTFTPDASSAGATITMPALLGEGEDHWELEASLDDALYYRIANTNVSSTTVDDEVDAGTGYALDGVLSEAIGDYNLLPSARYLAADGDRILFGGHWHDPERASQVGWTPAANSPGVGNDERLPLRFNNTLDLENYEGGGITGISQVANGSWYAFKWAHIYKLARTGDADAAYEAINISKTRGALPGSIVSGMDEYGRACIYFVDPIVGPSRIGAAGLQAIWGLQATVQRINLKATGVICRGIYYPNKQQVHWWISIDGADLPNYKIVLQVNEIQESVSGAHRGFTIATGRIAEATAVTIFNEWVTDGATTTLSERPFIGLTSPDFIQRCDTGDTDADVEYRAIIRSRPYFLAGLMGQWQAMKGALLAASSATASLVVKFIKDFGIEEKPRTTDLASTQAYVVKNFDDLTLGEAIAIQVEFSDPETP